MKPYEIDISILMSIRSFFEPNCKRGETTWKWQDSGRRAGWRGRGISVKDQRSREKRGEETRTGTPRRSWHTRRRHLLLLQLSMGGPNLEIFKFSLYLFVPIAALIHFGDPDWYRNTVVPVSTRAFPQIVLTIWHLSTAIDSSHLQRKLSRQSPLPTNTTLC
jgi:protein PET100, fungi type